ncbi:O-acetyl-ADP-ribose deacetylase (regulator of RNase III) [Melghirimyces profundicolus]|uniref:O-acetyl-ADP-ribose deacetylase (Regulator of RNase III) n=1 Tax=Melghirimyces profundicolus TaxID=1242148 RepID=A0A2T6BT12_9BACL|nr:macro domain-containing protein [Melghirimyces profundicolus]PTX59097.1 O-acetyl-ADP-ribose deacetylase (regulator of RNase III) [Melghirimyces profundicolus]
MITIQKGNLLESDCTVIAHQCNCFATMGAGIASQIARRYPEALEADKNFDIPAGDRNRLGKVSYAHSDGRLIFNLYGQFHYGSGTRETDYDALQRALDSMFIELYRHEDPSCYKVGLPYGIGCGLAGGSWETVEAIILESTEKFDHDVHLYKL